MPGELAQEVAAAQIDGHLGADGRQHAVDEGVQLAVDLRLAGLAAPDPRAEARDGQGQEDALVLAQRDAELVREPVRQPRGQRVRRGRGEAAVLVGKESRGVAGARPVDGDRGPAGPLTHAVADQALAELARQRGRARQSIVLRVGGVEVAAQHVQPLLQLRTAQHESDVGAPLDGELGLRDLRPGALEIGDDRRAAHAHGRPELLDPHRRQRPEQPRHDVGGARGRVVEAGALDGGAGLPVAGGVGDQQPVPAVVEADGRGGADEVLQRVDLRGDRPA